MCSQMAEVCFSVCYVLSTLSPVVLLFACLLDFILTFLSGVSFELIAGGVKRDVEKPPKCTRPNFILA